MTKEDFSYLASAPLAENLPASEIEAAIAPFGRNYYGAINTFTEWLAKRKILELEIDPIAEANDKARYDASLHDPADAFPELFAPGAGR
jgi:hypothetical protein